MEKLSTTHRIDLSAFIKSNGRTAEEIRRAQAILMLAEDIDEATITSITGLKRTTAIKIRKRYLKKGITALKAKEQPKNHVAF